MFLSALTTKKNRFDENERDRRRIFGLLLPLYLFIAFIDKFNPLRVSQRQRTREDLSIAVVANGKCREKESSIRIDRANLGNNNVSHIQLLRYVNNAQTSRGSGCTLTDGNYRSFASEHIGRLCVEQCGM